MAQNVDYTLIRGTALALSQYLGDSLQNAFTQNTDNITATIRSSVRDWNTTNKKLTEDDIASLANVLFPALQTTLTGAESNIDDTVKDSLLSWNSDNQSTTIPLSTINADFESNRNDLYALLSQQQDPAFTEFMISGTGAQLLYMIATAQTMNQVGMELAIRENFVTLAQQTSSVYAGLTNQGIRLSRKNPAKCIVRLTTTDSSISIPPFTQFNVNGVNYFNRDQIFWTPKLVQKSFNNNTEVIPSTENLVISAELYEGTMRLMEVTADGSPFFEVQFGNRDWAISNDDVNVFVNQKKWDRTAHNLHYSMGLYNYDRDNVWTEYTTASGNCIVQFGDGVNGNIPQMGATINIYYAETSGTAGNNYNLSAPVSCSDFGSVSGVVIDYAQGGSDERDVNDYRKMAPQLFSSQSRPCSISDYAAFVCNYPGVIDSTWLGQQEFAPNDPSQAMVIKGVLLTNAPWNDKDMSDFRDWLTGSGEQTTALIGANIYPELYLANEVPFDVQLQIFVKPYANENQIKSAITSALRDQYKAAYGVINRKVAISDIEGIVKNLTVDGIDYFDVQLPTVDMDIAWNAYAVLNNITIQMSPTDRR